MTNPTWNCWPSSASVHCCTQPRGQFHATKPLAIHVEARWMTIVTSMWTGTGGNSRRAAPAASHWQVSLTKHEANPMPLHCAACIARASSQHQYNAGAKATQYETQRGLLRTTYPYVPQTRQRVPTTASASPPQRHACSLQGLTRTCSRAAPRRAKKEAAGRACRPILAARSQRRFSRRIKAELRAHGRACLLLAWFVPMGICPLQHTGLCAQGRASQSRWLMLPQPTHRVFQRSGLI